MTTEWFTAAEQTPLSHYSSISCLPIKHAVKTVGPQVLTGSPQIIISSVLAPISYD